MSGNLKSISLYSLLGKSIIFNCEFEGYPPNSKAVIDQFVIKEDESFFFVLFEDIPGSLERIDPIDLMQKCEFSGSANPGLSLKQCFKVASSFKRARGIGAGRMPRCLGPATTGR